MWRAWNSRVNLLPQSITVQPGKNAESWNFQESYLNARITPWGRVPQNPSGFLFKMVAIAAGCILLYPKLM